MPFWRPKSHLHRIDEAEAYEHSYGRQRNDVKLVKLPPRRPRDPQVLAHGELLRRAFLDRLEHREDEPKREPASAEELDAE